ncbi:MAG: hypothetical protein IK013_01605 [Bacteroidales bacterium]|nr:hypothetical protein [Bacteroidales bacterium]
MRKGIKITLITLASLLGLLVAGVGIVLLMVFTPARLTKIVNQEAPNWLTCDFHLERAELTFFKSFPKLGIDIQDVTLINRMFGAPTDTLLHVDHCVASLNVRKLMRDKHVEVNEFLVKNGQLNIFTNKLGQSNLNILKPFAKDTTDTASYSFHLQKVETRNVHLRYINIASGLVTDVDNVNLTANGTWNEPTAEGNIKLLTDQLVFKTLHDKKIVAKYNKLDGAFKGSLNDMDKLKGTLDLALDKATFHADTNAYLDNRDLKLHSDLQAIWSEQTLQLENTQLALDQYKLNLDGTIHRDTAANDLALNLHYETGNWPLHDVLEEIPRAIIGNALDDMTLDGLVHLTGQVKGHLNERQKPVITTDVNLVNGSFAKKDFPLDFQKINSTFHLDLNPNDKTSVQVKKLNAYTGRNYLTATGTIQDLLGEMLFDLALTGDLHIEDFRNMLPEKIAHSSGKAKAAVNVKCNYDQIARLAIDQWTADGTFDFTQLNMPYGDSLLIASPALNLKFSFPVKQKPYKIGEWIHTQIQAPKLQVHQVGSMDIAAKDAHFDGFLNNLTDSSLPLKLGAKFQMETVNVKTDSLVADLTQPSGTFVMPDQNQMKLDYSGSAVSADLGSGLLMKSGALTLNAATHYNPKGSNALMQWNPTAKLSLQNGMVTVPTLEYPLELPKLVADINPKQCNISKGNGKIGNSDFSLSGKITQIDDYFNGKGLINGTLEFTSDYIDLNQIMDMFSGLGVSDSVMAEKPEDSQKDPFMVPYGMNIRMNTHIKKALYEDTYFRNIGGFLDLKDGTLVLEEMAVTHDAARMQLTAMYQSPRKNHLFLGLDFHLLDIKIDQLIALIPEVDTILPMLKAFAGNAEFHFAIETNLKSNYDLKYSTLRGAAAINGQNLVVLDQETFNNIAKKLKFKKNTPNRIDSLSAEMTIFKNEIDVYPFLVSLDKYQAILSGRHNLNMDYQYNISLIKPIRLGLDIIGTDKRRFKLGKAKYATLFRPERQNVVEQNVMQLKTRIHEALKANVKPQSVE